MRKSTPRPVQRGAIVNFSLCLLPLVLVAFCTAPAEAQNNVRAKADAPPDHASISGGLGGHYFVPKPLKAKYDALVDQVRALEAEIGKGQISSQDAAAEVSTLRTQLEAVREEIEQQKKFVAAARVHTKTETTTYELGPEKSLLILAAKVRVIGHDGPGIKCELAKTVLTPGEAAPADEEFEAIRVEHLHGFAPDLVGKPPAEVEAEEQALLQGPEGQQLKPEALAWRRKILDDRIAHYALYSALQGKEIDVIKLQGLSFQEGNRQLLLEVTSPNGGGVHSSEWSRHADLTVYVPSASVVAIQGGLRGLDVAGLNSHLLIRGDGDRDYDGRFRIRDVQGNVAADNMPLQEIERVEGDVSVAVTAYRGNSGTRHAGDTRTTYHELPQAYSYKDIRGDLLGSFVRARLELAGISGAIDIRNDYGDTSLTAREPLAKAAHRIISHSGHTELQLADGALGELPIMALTECGTVRVDGDDRSLDTISFEAHSPTERMRRGWDGFRTQPEGGPGALDFGYSDRVWQVIAGGDRTPGLDIINHGGSIRIGKSR